MSDDEPIDEHSASGSSRRNETDDDVVPPTLELVAQFLAEGQSDAAAALSVGRSPKFVQRARGADPAFVARVRQLKVARVAQAAAGLGALLEDALKAVERGLEANKPADQLRAAALVLDRSRIYRSDTEAAEKVEELETQIAELRSTVTALAGRSPRGPET